MRNYIKYTMLVFALSILLVACGGMSDEELVDKIGEAMDEVESVELTFKEKEAAGTSAGKAEIAEDGEEFRIEYDRDGMVLYGSENDLLIENGPNNVQDISGNREAMNIDDIIEILYHPTKKFEEIDDDFAEHIEVEKEDDIYKIEYVGDEEDEDVMDDMAEEYLMIMLSNQESRNFDEIDISKFSFDLEVDAETYLVKKWRAKLTYEEFGQKNKLDYTYTYEEYDEIDEIEKLEATDQAQDIFGTDPDDGIEIDPNQMGGTDLDADAVKGAGDYVEALIYATVFQDEKAFVKSAPDSMSEKEAKEEAKLQKEAFREVYGQNTRNNMAGFNVSDDQVEALTDAFLGAMKKTEFEVLTSRSEEPGSVVVTVSIKGLNDGKVYEETEKKMSEIIAKNEGQSEDELIDKNLETLIEEYKNAEVLDDAVEVPVNVTVQDGTYMVLLQDEYLMGFVQ